MAGAQGASSVGTDPVSTVRVRTDRGVFAVRGQGPADGPVVLVLHGFPDDASTFDGLGAMLAKDGWRVTAPYLRGYAPSPREGDLELEALADDLLAVIDAVSPARPVSLVGHDYGAQIGYSALTRSPGTFRAAAMLAGAHPAVIAANARRMPRQWWMSRYIALFQAGRLADAYVARHDFAYLDTLWRRWSPSFQMPPEHRTRVKATMTASWPAPLAMYRAGGFNIGSDPISIPTLFVAGASDGCLLAHLSDGQHELFTGGYRRVVWSQVGHYPHLERPKDAAEEIAGFFGRYN